MCIYFDDCTEDSSRVLTIKEENLWQEVRNVYLDKKCRNADFNKKSRSIFAETIKEIYTYYFK